MTPRGPPECIETTLAAAFEIHEQLRTAAAVGDETAMSVDQCFRFMQEHDNDGESVVKTVNQEGDSDNIYPRDELETAKIEQSMKFMANEFDVMNAMGRVIAECELPADKVVVR